MAIAEATLHSLVETTKCKTLFITHYPLVASNLEKKFPQDVENLHMGYEAESRIDGTREVTFLYRLTSGMASGEPNPFMQSNAPSCPPQSHLVSNVAAWLDCQSPF